MQEAEWLRNHAGSKEEDIVIGTDCLQGGGRVYKFVNIIKPPPPKNFVGVPYDVVGY